MIRTLFMLFTVFCTAVLLTQVGAVAVMWQQGFFQSDRWTDLQLAWRGDTFSKPIPPAEVKASETPSAQEIREQRVIRILQLETRERELSVLKEAAAGAANQLIVDRQTFEELKEKFRKELDELREKAVSEAIEQARGVLLASPPTVSAERLTEVPLEDAVILMRGMPEKQIAKILQEMNGIPDRAERSKQIFDALRKGDPERPVISNASSQLDPPNL